MTRVDCMPEIGLAGVRTQGQGRVDGAPRNLFMVILKAVGEQNPDHVLYLLLTHKVQLQFVKEEVGDERVHSHCVLVLGESFLIVIHQVTKRVPSLPVVMFQ